MALPGRNLTSVISDTASTCVHESPRLVLRKRPLRGAALTTLPSALNPSRLTYWNSAPVVEASCDLVTPLFVYLKMPAQRIDSALKNPSLVRSLILYEPAVWEVLSADSPEEKEALEDRGNIFGPAVAANKATTARMAVLSAAGASTRATGRL